MLNKTSVANTIIYFVLSTIFAIITFIFLFVAVSTYLKVGSGQELALQNNKFNQTSEFFETAISDYIELSVETRTEKKGKATNTYWYWLAITTDNEYFIIETLNTKEPIIGINVFNKNISDTSKKYKDEIIKDAQIVEKTVTSDIKIFKMSSADEYKSSWYGYAIGSVVALVLAILFFYTAKVNAKKYKKVKNSSATNSSKNDSLNEAN